MNKEEIPIEYYLTKNGEVIKFVRYDELDKYKQVLDKIRNCMLKDILILKGTRKMSNEEMIIRLEATLKILEEIE